ncbi:DUF748 domain-containing protein [Bdellovibrio reynosensis]|uniref:DUF748 domain-containing protein n=1 Tax=Bdellovibrio reynosensis TaxID=2835041 RepID=A0ABY4CAQ0_9BACT|nr:DUF748 domain-containing protein [Bdellovibrio reynosensis]UOF01794.1 DUF748 domain-containing protein [Bdellovibrio reynosensis]
MFNWKNINLKSKKVRVILIVVLVLGAIRVALPFAIKTAFNSFMGDFSKVFAVHLEDVDLGILRGAYRLEGLEGKLKEKDRVFLQTESIDISMAWRDLFRGDLRTDIVIEGLDLKLNEELLEGIKKNAAESKKDAEKAGEKVFPVNISRVDIKNSSIEISKMPGAIKDLTFKINQIQGRVSNATPTEESGKTVANIKGVLQDSATIYGVAEVNQKKIPNDWLLAVELRKFDLKAVNPLTEKYVPLSFRKGSLDLYAEVKGENNAVKGYLKPFMSDMEFVGDQKDFKGLKHFGIEVSSDLAKLIFSNKENKTLATKVDFNYEKGKLDWSAGDVMANALEHGYRQEIPAGLENKYRLE